MTNKVTELCFSIDNANNPVQKIHAEMRLKSQFPEVYKKYKIIEESEKSG